MTMDTEPFQSSCCCSAALGALTLASRASKALAAGPAAPAAGGIPGGAAPATDIRSELKMLAPNVYAFLQREAPGQSNFSVSNFGIVAGPKTLLAIDAGGGPQHARNFLAAAKPLGKPFDRVIITHEHPDHIVGLTQFPARHRNRRAGGDARTDGEDGAAVDPCVLGDESRVGEARGRQSGHPAHGHLPRSHVGVLRRHAGRLRLARSRSHLRRRADPGSQGAGHLPGGHRVLWRDAAERLGLCRRLDQGVRQTYYRTRTRRRWCRDTAQWAASQISKTCVITWRCLLRRGTSQLRRWDQRWARRGAAGSGPLRELDRRGSGGHQHGEAVLRVQRHDRRRTWIGTSRDRRCWSTTSSSVGLDFACRLHLRPQAVQYELANEGFVAAARARPHSGALGPAEGSSPAPRQRIRTGR